VHGDSSGLKMPPSVAPYQVAIVPIWRKETEREQVAAAVAEVERDLRAAGVRVKTDWRDQVTAGYKFNDWELRGVPLRLEIGPKDVQKGQVVLVRRDNRVKESVARADLVARARGLLDEIQQALYDAAIEFRRSRTYRVANFEEFAARMADRPNLGFIETWWCGDATCEAEIKAQTQATNRGMPMERTTSETEGACIYCGKPASHWAIFAKAY
ncbi:MAG TPA: His/Gly/Thr/Pro-type tRNA ligase C-terminal domain-containing protein, partial [Ktedonobacterales bacterium]|nr:His/Gly/Thr/Pro-type tRNA ligase C-terminal domain-containing protein [Ktedonobacterales bacterium]